MANSTDVDLELESGDDLELLDARIQEWCRQLAAVGGVATDTPAPSSSVLGLWVDGQLSEFSQGPGEPAGWSIGDLTGGTGHWFF